MANLLRKNIAPTGVSNTKPFSWILVTVSLLVALAGTALFLASPTFINTINWKVLDVLLAGPKKIDSSSSVVLVDIDEASLESYGQWPWPRELLAKLLLRIQQGDAQTIALDMILAEPERPALNKKPKEVLKNEVKSADASLALVLSQGPYILGNKFLFQSSFVSANIFRHPLEVTIVQQGNNNALADIYEAQGVVDNRAILSRVSRSVGFLNARPDQDGLLRHMPLVIFFQGSFYPSLALASVLQSKDVSSVQLIVSQQGILSLRFSSTTVPLDKHGNLLVPFGSRNHKSPRISARSLLAGESIEALKGKIVLVGSSAAGLDKTYQVPGTAVFSGLDLHAQTIDTLMGEFFVKRNHQYPFYEALCAILIALLQPLFVVRTRLLVSTIGAILLFVGLWSFAKLVLLTSGAVFSPLLPWMVLGTNTALLSLLQTRRYKHKAEKAAGNALLLLKQSENSLDSIIDSIPDVVFRLDDQGNITFVSPAITRYKEPQELVGQPITGLVAPEDKEKARYKITERRTGNRATNNLELRLLLNERECEQDQYRYFDISAQGLYRDESDGSKTFIGTQGIVRDITEQKKLKEKLIQAQKLEAIGSLAAGVAHDLNNVLSGLVSYPELLLLDLPEDSPLRSKVYTIQQSGKKAAAIVQDMLTLARRGVIHQEIFSVNTLIKEYWESADFSLLRERHPLVLFRHELSDTLLPLNGSPIHCTKTIMNLVSNAAESQVEGGEVLLTTRNYYLDSSKESYEIIPEGEYVLLSVQDKGSGISAEERKRIFEPFYTKKKMGSSGTGLGMTIIWATVKDLGGYVDLLSNPSNGTRFDIYLPPFRGQEPGEEQFENQSTIGSGQVLVVDDGDEQRKIAAEMLSQLGFIVEAVSSGEDACRFLEVNKVDLVFLDMIMPGGMDGLATYEKIQTIAPHQKVIVVSGYSQSDRLKKMQDLGAASFLQKPYTLDILAQAVDKVLSK